MFDPSQFSFVIKKQSATSGARLGTLTTPHGVVETPAFIFCATKAAIKGATPKQMKDAGTQIILSNTYHLMLQPGGDLVESMGGLHKFMGWDGPMLTDSGGYQIFSLGHGSVSEEIKGKRNAPKQRSLKLICEEGATFKSYMGGKVYTLTPESSIKIQHQLGADLIVVLDECTPFNVEKSYTERSMHMSHRWAVRSLNAFNILNTEGRQALYGIVQGGVYEDLREAGTDFVNSQPFFGHAVGGSLGASKDQMEDIVSYTMSKLSKDRPVHLLGIGGIRDIFHGVEQGIDTFDCVHPTRLARHGGALVRAKNWQNQPYKGADHLNMNNAIHREDPRPIDDACSCETCKNYSRAYIHHLFKAKEILALTALTVHNVAFMNDLLTAIRTAIAEDRLEAEKANWLME